MEETKEVTKTESQEHAEEFTACANKLGSIAYQIKQLDAEAEELMVKMRNATVSYNKAKKAETKAHMQEVTPDTGVTNETQH